MKHWIGWQDCRTGRHSTGACRRRRFVGFSPVAERRKWLESVLTLVCSRLKIVFESSNELSRSPLLPVHDDRGRARVARPTRVSLTSRSSVRSRRVRCCFRRLRLTLARVCRKHEKIKHFFSVFDLEKSCGILAVRVRVDCASLHRCSHLVCNFLTALISCVCCSEAQQRGERLPVFSQFNSTQLLSDRRLLVAHRKSRNRRDVIARVEAAVQLCGCVDRVRAGDGCSSEQGRRAARAEWSERGEQEARVGHLHRRRHARAQRAQTLGVQALPG